MMTFGNLSLLAPWALLGLGALPVIWWLLRLTPPAPARVRFPPLRLLLGLVTQEETSAKTPLWLILLRLTIATFLVLAAAGPLLNQASQWRGSGPLLLVVDNGWSAAGDWQDRQRLLIDITNQATRDSRPVHLLATAPPPAAAGPLRLLSMTGHEAKDIAAGLQPRPWPSDRAKALAVLGDGPLEPDRSAQVIWLSDSLNHGEAAAFAKELARYGAISLVTKPTGAEGSMILRPPILEGDAMTVRAERTESTGGTEIWLRAYADDDRLLLREAISFPDGEAIAETRLEIPTELLNGIGRLSLENRRSAATTALLDERWRRRPVGIVSGDGNGDLPLLSSIYFLNRAMEPFSEVRQGTIAGLLQRQLAMMVIPDPGSIGGKRRTSLEGWIAEGGVAVRFAGPLLAQATSGRTTTRAAPLVPVPLRRGDRVIGGAMSWTKPARLAAFDADSPFHGLIVPSDVTVTRQVLAQPTVDLAARTWARLADGTPLVTAEKRGKGWLVLFHTTANTQWSNLALSGLLVEMLQRLVNLSQGVVDAGQGPPLEPLQTLDGFGVLKDAPGDAEAISRDDFTSTTASPRHPPGLYGKGIDRRALNLSQNLKRPVPLGDLPVAATRLTYGSDPAIDVRPWLLIIVIVLALGDFAASLWLRGLLRPPRLASPLVIGIVLFGQTLIVPQAQAQTADDAYALENSTKTRLAYVITGDEAVDRISRLGLSGLSRIVRRRTAAELSEPQGVDLAKHDLAFFPLMYWPVVPGAADMSERARQNVNAYMQNGGTILFDTRDQSQGSDLGELRALARRLDIPPLVVASTNHVLTRAFYLLQDFPGRWTGGALWVERAGERINDGVSPVIAGGNDWAAAWALDDVTQRPIFPAVPGGERQRELAYRFGINLVMYVLTGNYKADQVHLPAIMRRLGQ